MVSSKKSGKFVKIKCSKCKSNQVVFGRATTKIRCNDCGRICSTSKRWKRKNPSKS